MHKKITKFGSAILHDRYLQKDENFDDLIKRLCDVYSVDKYHRSRMKYYIKNLWFVPATPVLVNGGTNKGLPISCYLNSVADSMRDISDTWFENVWLGSNGGGIGTSWSDVRSVGESIGKRGQTTGIIPFVKVLDSITLAVSQGSLRRGAGACYLHISHPEIEEFINIRKPSGDLNRRSLNLHHGVVISDKFMECLEKDKDWDLVNPTDNNIRKSISARELFIKILETRVETGEPYLLFIDNVNKAVPEHHKYLNLYIEQSNLCSEIVLPTVNKDYNNKKRTAVCCLGSINLEYFDEWVNNKQFIKDCLYFLDSVLSDFIDKASKIKGFENAVYSAKNERSVGLGVMGLHSYFQQHLVAFDSVEANKLNKKIFKIIHQRANKANEDIGKALGSCQDFLIYQQRSKESNGGHRRFSYATAIAPTANISIIGGLTSPCIEPISANVYTHKTLSGSFEVKNKYLIRELVKLNKNTDKIWNSILENEGSVQHLDFLSTKLKHVFKTAFEIDQKKLIKLACDRTPYIDQAQSVNLFLNSNISKYDLFDIHYQAWKQGIKSLYYVRSKSLQRAGYVPELEDQNLKRKQALGAVDIIDNRVCDGEVCDACQ